MHNNGPVECMRPNVLALGANVWDRPAECIRGVECMGACGLLCYAMPPTSPAILSLGGWLGWNVVIQELTGGVQQGLTPGHWTGDTGTLGGAFPTPQCGTPASSVGHQEKEMPGVNLKDRRTKTNCSPHSFGHVNILTLLVARTGKQHIFLPRLQERYIFKSKYFEIVTFYPPSTFSIGTCRSLLCCV